FSVADFRALAKAAIEDISQKGRLPLLAGGTGLYVDSLLYPYNFAADSGVRPELRCRLQADYLELGGEALHQRLAQVDPAAAARIHPHDSRRLI
ncbi:tRNA dimethylallyltransferase, partial [Klebsiella pneumoniae]|uniref:tRNA dimethylallyltransferase n=1 Tax=Klebsiella pneumoniae TaxID=573 RepID=UPI0021B15132